MGTQISTMEPNLERAHIVYHMSTVRGMTRSQVSEETGLTMGQVARDVERYCRLTGAATISEWQAEQDDAHPAFDAQREDDNVRYDRIVGTDDSYTFVPTDRRREVLRAYTGDTYSPSPFYAYAARTVRSVVGVGDFHGHPDPSVMAALIRADADVYVFGGDTLDNQQASRHPSETRDEAQARRQRELRDEIADVRALIGEVLESTRGEIHVMRGNHDQWPIKRLMSELPDWVLDFFREPLQVVVEDFGGRVQMVAQPVKIHFPDGTALTSGHANEFIYILGDVLFSHLNFTSSVAEPGVSKLYRNWFLRWERTLQMQHIRMLVHFHVHARNMLNVAGGHMTLVEPGMGGSVAVETYKHSYQGKWKPSVNGFVQFEQYLTSGGEWRTDTESISLVAPRMGTAQASKRVEKETKIA